MSNYFGKKKVELAEGEYQFRITDVQEGQYPGSARVAACPKITLTLDVNGQKLDHIDLICSDNRYYAHILRTFIRSIGLDPDGDVDMSKVIGKVGRAHVVPKKGTYKTFYNIGEWLPFDETKMTIKDTKPAAVTTATPAKAPEPPMLEDIEPAEAAALIEKMDLTDIDDGEDYTDGYMTAVSNVDNMLLAYIEKYHEINKKPLTQEEQTRLFKTITAIMSASISIRPGDPF